MPPIITVSLAHLLPSLCRVPARMSPLDSSPRPLLSPLELRLLRGLAGGATMRELAASWSYSYAYLREVRASAIRQLGASTIVQAVYVATRRGLIR